MGKKLLFLLGWISGFGQVSGVVRDSVSGKPVPYVNIWNEDLKKNVSADENGAFTVDASGKKANLVFSAIGYQTKHTTSALAKSILMQPATYELATVAIETPKAKHSLKVKSIGGSWVHYYTGSNLAKFFPADEEVLRHPYLKEIVLRTWNESDGDCTINIKLLKASEDGLPGDPLVEENIIVPITKGDHNTKINVEKYHVKVPAEGLFVVAERLIIPQNKFAVSYKMKGASGDKIEYKSHKYEPSFGFLPSDENDTWEWRGKWEQNGKEKLSDPKAYENLLMKKYHEKYKTAAMGIVLTD